MNLSESYSKKADSILTSSKQKPENTLLKDYENYDLLSRTLSADIKPVFTGLNLAPAGVIVDSIIQRAADERTRANNDSSYVPTTEVIIGVGTAGA